MKLLFLGIFLHLLPLFSNEGLQYSHQKVPNFSYFNCINTIQSIHILEVDPNLYQIKIVKARDQGLGRESLHSLHERHGALASINGGFFSIGGPFDGKACGALKINHWYCLQSKPRGCIGWSCDQQNVKMDKLITLAQVFYNGQHIILDGMNQMRNHKQIVLFSPCFCETTLTKFNGEEVIIENSIVQKIIPGGNCTIPKNGYVLSIDEKHPLFQTFQVGKPISFSIKTIPLIDTLCTDWDYFDYIIGGAPLLLHPNYAALNFELEKTRLSFLTCKHARTAVGFLSDGRWIFVVVEKLGFFDGMTIYELASLMKQLGCIYALNLDGGKSSAMIYKGALKTMPCEDDLLHPGEKISRLLSDAILILPKK